MLWEDTLLEFIGITVVLGGGAAWLLGRATALIWAPYWKLVFYAFLLTAALRFIHFSLFGGSFFLPVENFATAVHYGVVDFIVLLAAATLGRRVMRTRQMMGQYGFIYEAAGRLNWRPRA